MATEVVMPKLGLTMENGLIGAWLVAEGNSVAKGDPLLEVVTDKVSMIVESQAEGVLRKILIPAGDQEIPVATPIAIIAAPDEEIDGMLGGLESSLPSEARGALAATDSSAAKSLDPVAAGGLLPAARPAHNPSHSELQANARPHRASPKARKIAQEQGIDLAAITGSGTGGRIVSADLASVVSDGSHLASLNAIELTRAQAVAAERLTASYQEIPHIHIAMDVSAVWMQQFRDGYRLNEKVVSFNDLIIVAVGKALSQFPRINSNFVDGQLIPSAEINVGIATDTPHGLMVPVVRCVSDKSIEEVARESATLIDRARGGDLRLDDMSGGTFTISNLGMFGVKHFTAIINPPQVSILAVGAIKKRIVALENDAIAVRPQLTLTLAADHRAVDGAMAACFLQRLQEILETPGLLA